MPQVAQGILPQSRKSKIIKAVLLIIHAGLADAAQAHRVDETRQLQGKLGLEVRCPSLVRRNYLA